MYHCYVIFTNYLCKINRFTKKLCKNYTSIVSCILQRLGCRCTLRTLNACQYHCTYKLLFYWCVYINIEKPSYAQASCSGLHVWHLCVHDFTQTVLALYTIIVYSANATVWVKTYIHHILPRPPATIVI